MRFSGSAAATYSKLDRLLTPRASAGRAIPRSSARSPMPRCSSTASTAATIGISTPRAAARAAIDAALAIPSTTERRPASAASRLFPCPRLTPSAWLRDCAPPQVNTRSPRPERPAKVSARAPLAMPSRVISARPRVISAARALSPRRSPSTMPQAIARTFFTAPPISTPTGSSDRYGRKRRLPSAAMNTRAAPASRLAIVIASRQLACELGRKARPRERRHRVAQGTIRLPARTWSSAIRSLIPLAHSSSGTLDSRCEESAASASRRNCAGTTTTTASAPPAASARSAVVSIAGSSAMPGRYTGFSRRSRIVSAIAGSRTQITTSLPARRATMASAVPQAPAPMMASRVIWSWPMDRAASAAAPARRAGHRDRGAAAPIRPRRSSHRYRCTAPAAARRNRRVRISSETRQAARSNRALAATPPAATRLVPCG